MLGFYHDGFSGYCQYFQVHPAKHLAAPSGNVRRSDHRLNIPCSGVSELESVKHQGTHLVMMCAVVFLALQNLPVQDEIDYDLNSSAPSQTIYPRSEK
jgi:hypothetical protein